MSASSEKNFSLGLNEHRVFYVTRALSADMAQPISMPPKPRKSKRINKKQKERGFS